MANSLSSQKLAVQVIVGWPGEIPPDDPRSGINCVFELDSLDALPAAFEHAANEIRRYAQRHNLPVDVKGTGHG